SIWGRILSVTSDMKPSDLKIVNLDEALSGFSSGATYLIVGSFFIVAAMKRSGLGVRLEYNVISIIGISPKRITFRIVIINILLAFIIPASTARVALMLPICVSLIKILQGDIRLSNLSKQLMIVLCCTCSSISAGILTATVINPIAVTYLSQAVGANISFLLWLKLGFLPALIMTIFAWWLATIVFPVHYSDDEHIKEYIHNKLKLLCPMICAEKKALIIITIIIVLWMVGDILHVDSTTVALLGGIFLCIPKLGCITWKDFQDNVSLSVLFVCSGRISLGLALCQSGAANWISSNLFEILHLQQFSPFILLCILIFIIQFMHIFFVGTATMANAFFPIILSVMQACSVDPVIPILISAFLIGGYPILLFFNTTPNILCCETKLLLHKDFYFYGFILSMATCITYII
ncbi:SLC13 family permease, partial [Pectinatus frisingensis]|uniref:SLC13 family permease n=1 Tax=Pectinatus frisingensis TaxID=865 RepID=UPI001E2FE635